MKYKTSINPDHIITSPEELNLIMKAGKGVVTLMAPFGVRHSYLFKKPHEDSGFPDDVIFVFAVHNDDDHQQLFYVGMIENNTFRLTARSRFNPDTDISRGAKYIVRMANNKELFDSTPMVAFHNGCCARCGRELTSDKAIKAGFGRKCLRRVAKRS